MFNADEPSESEDCLYLNVYTPSTPPPIGGRAVMFWLYGGGLAFGYSGTLAYDGSSFAAYQDIIMVTINYRTNGNAARLVYVHELAD
jgi:carboxylesterase type B